MTERALFLDRDGVINIDKGYVYKIDDFDFVPGVFNFCRQAVDRGYQIIVVTNQSGIGRGYYTEGDFDILTQWMIAKFERENIKIAKVFYCPHHPVEAKGDYLKKCSCRKPEPGMLMQAISEFALKAEQCLMLGDSQSDILAAQAAGVRGVKLESGKADYAALAALLL